VILLTYTTLIKPSNLSNIYNTCIVSSKFAINQNHYMYVLHIVKKTTQL